MMKLIKNILILIVTTFILFNYNTVSAMTPIWPSGARFTRGVGNTCYYVSPSATGYTGAIREAANNWENPGWYNPINMTAVSSNYATHIDFYAVNQNSSYALVWGAYAYTSFWDGNGNAITVFAEAPDRNYFYTEIKFNLDQGMSYDYRTSKHEIGHAFGLDHTEDKNSIMYPNEQGNVSTVQYADNEAINYLY